MYLTFHSYGQYILYPWGYTNTAVPHNEDQLYRMGNIAARAMHSASGRRHSYQVGSAAKLLYPAAGTYVTADLKILFHSVDACYEEKLERKGDPEFSPFTFS